MSRELFERAADLISPPPSSLSRYFMDPVGFVHDMFEWPPGESPTEYQDRVLAELVEHGRVAVKGPHGLGKTALEAWCILWFSITRDAEGVDFKVPTTASVWRQLEKYLWPETRKWSRLLRWDRLGRAPFSRDELLALSLKLTHGEAFAVASDDATAIEGAHATELLYVFDESKSVPAKTFDAAEGAFAGAGTDTSSRAFALAGSTPGEPVGRFYEIFKRRPGTEDWRAVSVNLDDAVKAGRVSRQWAEQRRRQWGGTSAVYLNRVEGEFAEGQKDGVIPLSWVEAAVERWRQAHPDCSSERHVPGCVPDVDVSVVGVDVGRSGPDPSVLALRHGDEIRELRKLPQQLTTATAGHVKGVLRANDQARAVVDVVGIGAGVVDVLREDEAFAGRVEAFNAGEGTRRKDKSGELEFLNARAAAWWAMREILDPESGREVALPDDDEMIGDLSAPTWKMTAAGKVQVESKDDIRKRLGRSTDCGDAVVQAFWLDGELRRRRQVPDVDLSQNLGLRQVPWANMGAPSAIGTGWHSPGGSHGDVSWNR